MKDDISMTGLTSVGPWRQASFSAIAALLLAACDQSSSQQPKQAVSNEEGGIGRWILVPATSNPVMNQGSPFMFAWRFDTKTGATEMCTYDPGGWMNAAIKMEMPENLSCHAPPEPFELLKNLRESASSFEKAIAAYNREDYAGALQLLRPLAESGNVRAQAMLGAMYQSGIGVLKDYIEAAKWFRRAADTGDATAQYEIGIMHLNGQGMPRDPVSAYMWLDLAAMRDPRLPVMERNRLAGSMTAAQVAEAQELARKGRPQRER
jgi:hypothetical protein